MDLEKVTPNEEITNPPGAGEAPVEVSTGAVETAPIEDEFAPPGETPGTSDEVDSELDALGSELAAATPEQRPAIQARINKRFGQISLAHKQEIENVRLRTRLEALEGQGQMRSQEGASGIPAVPELVLPPEPNPKEYTDEEGYEDSVRKAQVFARWEVQKARAEWEHQTKAERAQEEQRTNQRKGQEFYEKVCEKYPDFRNLTGYGMPEPTPVVAGAIVRAENAEKVAYYLAKNPKELARFNGMEPIAAVFAIGKLDIRFSNSPQPKTTSTAKPPIAPVKPGAGQAHGSLAEMDMDDFVAARNAEEFGAKGG